MSTITQDQERAALDRVPTQLYIGGEWRDGGEGATIEVEDPSTGEALCEIADATPDDAKAALDAAVEAQDEWRNHPPRERGEILRRAFEEITDRVDELALLMTLEMGKPVDDFGPTLRRALDLDVPSLIVLPIDYSLDVAISQELGTETVAA